MIIWLIEWVSSFLMSTKNKKIASYCAVISSSWVSGSQVVTHDPLTHFHLWGGTMQHTGGSYGEVVCEFAINITTVCSGKVNAIFHVVTFWRLTPGSRSRPARRGDCIITATASSSSSPYNPRTLGADGRLICMPRYRCQGRCGFVSRMCVCKISKKILNHRRRRRGAAGVRAPLKFGENIFGKYYVKFRHFLAKIM